MNDPTQRTEPIAALRRLTDPAVQGQLQSDAELLTLFVESGSRAAIETLVHRYAAMVASVCRCTVSDPACAEDAFQATFLVLLKSAKKIQNRRSVAAWLHGVAFRTACRLRKQRQAHVTEQSPDEVIALNQEDDPLHRLARKLELEALDQELEKLPPAVREILVEHYLLGYTAPQIAERNALSLSAVEGRIRRGRYALLRQLAKRGISLSVLLTASTWFQEHLQATEAEEWTETFLDCYLQLDAAAISDATSDSSNRTVRLHDLDWPAEISSLVYGELNMLSSSFSKAAYPTLAALLVGGLFSFNLFGDGGAPPSGSKGISSASAGSSQATNDGATLSTLPEESPVIMAQLSAGLGGTSPAVQDASGAPAQTTTTTSAATAGPSTGTTSTGTTSAGTTAGGESATSTAEQSQTKEPPKPIEWQVPPGEQPSWMQDGLAELEESERELRDQVRSKLRKRVQVDFTALPLKQAIEELSAMCELDLYLDTSELENAGLALDSPISVQGNMSLREFFRRIETVGEVQLAYVVHESSVELTSDEDADRDPAIRYYDLAYVLPNSSNLFSVMEAIQTSIAPDSWLANGGVNSISVVGSMLVISCPESLHQKIEVLLARVGAMNKKNLEIGPVGPVGGGGVGYGGMGGGMGGMGGGMGGMGGGMGGMGGGGMGGMF